MAKPAVDTKVCIKGDDTKETGYKIIKYLESLGGINACKRTGCSVGYYFIEDNIIECSNMRCPSDYTLITLPVPKSKLLPYLVGEVKCETIEEAEEEGRLQADADGEAVVYRATMVFTKKITITKKVIKE